MTKGELIEYIKCFKCSSTVHEHNVTRQFGTCQYNTSLHISSHSFNLKYILILTQF